LLNYPWRERVLVWDSFTPVVDSEICLVPSFDKPPVLGPCTKVLSGPEFIPLRHGIKNRDWSFTNSPKKLFVLAGGSDPFGLIPYLHRIFIELNLNLSITFVGMAISSTSKSIQFIDFSENIDLLLNEADLVIATASTSSYEILARGIPLAIVQATDNQASNYSKFVASNFAVGLGIRKKNSHWELDRESLVDFISGCEQQLDKRSSVRPPLDLNGSSRIANALEDAWEG
jgi:spore coat polysaccharide biosynthesis predicted glycosyltransferase SpsG